MCVCVCVSPPFFPLVGPLSGGRGKTKNQAIALQGMRAAALAYKPRLGSSASRSSCPVSPFVEPGEKKRKLAAEAARPRPSSSKGACVD